MPFIPNKPTNNCIHEEHNPPNGWLPPVEGGTWVCPQCGKETIISPAPTLTI